MILAGKYLLEVSLAVSLILLIYALVLRRYTFFKANRAYLLTGLIISFVLPLISLPVSVSQPASSSLISDLNPIRSEYVPVLFDTNGASEGLPIYQALTILYFFGVALSVIRFTSGIVRTVRLKSNSVVSTIDGVRVHLKEGVPTFSFFSAIISAPRNLNDLVLRHEMAHVRQRHWIDLLIVEMCSIVLWFNPVLFFYKRAIKIQHEFLADQGAVLGSSEKIEEYLRCLVRVAHSTNSIPATSLFSAHSIKTRIKMITKNQTPVRYTSLYLLVVPVVAFLLFAFQDSSNKATKLSEPIYVLTIQNIPTDVPVDVTKVQRTFDFGEKFNPVTNKMQHHSGIDFLTNEGENVMATADGIVVDAGFDEIKGNYVMIKHSDQIATQYFHMQRVTVKKGVNIRKGEVIGLVGNTGLSVKNHLHYEVLKNGKAVNPKEYLPKTKEGC
jgi:beta-lactamase regulating signal transducer with metallopeptidase domain